MTTQRLAGTSKRLFLAFGQLFNKLNSLLGADIFISYARRDGSSYAMGLADELTIKGFWPHYDRHGAPATVDLPARLLRQVRRSKMLVVVASQEGRSSAPIATEIKTFPTQQRPVLLIDIDGNLRISQWFPNVSGAPSIPDSVEALAAGKPSAAVLAAITNAATSNVDNVKLERGHAFVGTIDCIRRIMMPRLGVSRLERCPDLLPQRSFSQAALRLLVTRCRVLRSRNRSASALPELHWWTRVPSALVSQHPIRPIGVAADHEQ